MKCGYLVPSKVWRTFFFYCSPRLVTIRERVYGWSKVKGSYAGTHWPRAMLLPPQMNQDKQQKRQKRIHLQKCSFYIGGLHLPCCRGTMASGVSASLPCQMLGKLAQHEASLPHGGASSHHPSRTSPHAGQACPNVV